MSICCTPLYVKIPFVSPTGDIRIKRGTGDYPSCGYYENYTGSPELSNYDYYTVDIQYNSGSGFWTFSGNSTGFNDSSIYRSVQTGNPCNPVGEYTGGLFDPIRINSDPFGDYPIYDFESSFKYDSKDISIIGQGSGIHLERDVTFKFSFLDRKNKYISNSTDMQNSLFFKSVSYDILNENGIVAYPNYLEGYVSKFTFTEQDNIKVFGYYEPNFGVRARTRDDLLSQEGVAQVYTYGNRLFIPEIQIQDKQGTTKWFDSETGSSTTGVLPSGSIEDAVIIKTVFANDTRKTRASHVDVHASETESFDINDSNLVASKNLDASAALFNIELNSSFGLDVNKDYWFSMVGHSKIGSGNAVKFGPHKIYQKEDAPLATNAPELNISYRGASSSNVFKTGSINQELTGSSGIVDRLLIDKQNYGFSSGIYDGPDFLFKTVETNLSGQWIYTTFDYSLEFKNPLDPYSNISKNVKLNATGTSIDPLNSGMPLFEISDSNTGAAVELGINYTESGLYLVANTGHGHLNFKYQRNSF
tara:strand:+ start:1061 stop:2653 length:1593 start_codon:yes stop_codon:yes gene_type:complete